MKPHLWEVEHPYYCNEGNYFANESCESYFKTIDGFLSGNMNSDFDMNLVFRWDWVEENDEGESDYNGDDYYRNGLLKIFWLGQRKGLYRWSIIEVCRADEEKVISFLMPRLEHLMNMWQPLTRGE